jgi:hypothetical protein
MVAGMKKLIDCSHRAGGLSAGRINGHKGAPADTSSFT